MAGAGEAFVVGGPRGDKQTPWPRLFHNLRASCETDLLAGLRIASGTAWIGHPAEVALKRYAQARAGDFDRAAGRPAVQNAAQLPAEVVQFAVQSQPDASGLETTKSEETRGNVAFGESEFAEVISNAGSRVTRLGFESAPAKPTKHGSDAQPGYECGAKYDAPTSDGPREPLDPAAVLASLTPGQRSALMTLLGAAPGPK